MTTYPLLIIAALLYLGPFLWMVGTSLKTPGEATGDPPAIAAGELAQRGVPDDAGWMKTRAGIARYNYWDRVLADPGVDFVLCARNTVIIAGMTVIGSLLSSSLVAYSLAKLRWRGRGLALGLVLGTMMLPFVVVMVPQYDIFRRLHWIGTSLPLWGPSFFGVPFYIFLLRQFMLAIPDELLDAARIDGCSEWRIFWQLVLPLSKPALAVVAVFSFMAAWNDFLAPLVYLFHKQHFTLALSLQFFQSKSGGTSWELLMAASVLILLPVLALFFLAQKTFVQGIATTGLKG